MSGDGEMVTENKPDAEDFKTHLLVTLGKLGGFVAEVPVPFRSTYGPICTAMGITLDQFGRDSEGKYRVSQWIGQTFRYLKKEGFTVQPPNTRGKWALTLAGVREARSRCSEDEGNTQEKEEDTQETTTPMPIIEEPEDPTVGVSYPVGPGADESEYHPDPYIRSLAAERTSCFGAFTPRSTVCDQCALSGPCRNFVAARLSALAVGLAQKDEEEKAQREAAKNGKPPKTKKPKTKTRPPISPGQPGVHQIRNFGNPRPCLVCGELIGHQVECYWLQGDGNGLFHLECAAEEG